MFKLYFRFRHIFLTILILILIPALWLQDALTIRALPILSQVEDRLLIPVETDEIPNWPAAPQISAQSAILMDADSGAILYEKNIHEQLYPASTTKLLTCLIAVENCSLDEMVTFSHDAIYDTPWDSSHIALDVGESITLEQCLNAVLIASANEAAFGLAEHVSGTSWRDFADMMNERATELGCVDSHFVNPNGLPDENHYTSAYDLAMIGRAFFANELLCKISSTQKLELPATATQPDNIVAYSKNQLFAGKTYAYEYLVGSKTGYTNAARNILVSCAQKDGMKLIAVVMVEESPTQFADTVALFNYGFNNFDRVNISETETKYNIDNAGFFYSNNDIFGSSKPILSLNTRDCIIVPKTISFSDVESTISYDTGNEKEAALITYSYRGHFLGAVSVDFAGESESYSFESGTMQSGAENENTDSTPRPRIIFINVFKVILWLVGIAGICIALIFIRAFFVNYHFSTNEKNNRRSWLKRRRKKRRRRPRRPNRFRDFDY
ncbi:MAG: D-alanyl-D-alanine carboxypeptidase [Lachnospiraceae bacterium]|nr:D-alanyl-D-alanine carboxypeptidase [Lachnospiraceae bacterium]